MIYINFLLVITAIFLFSIGPAAENGMFSLPNDLLALLALLWAFWLFNRFHFRAIRQALDEGHIDNDRAKKYFFSRINLHFLFAVCLFAVEVFVFDLRIFLTRLPVLGGSETFVNAAGLAYLLVQLAMVWYWGFRFMGDVLDIGRSAADYIRANMKFNLAFVIPWLLISLVYDLLYIINPAWFAEVVNTALFHLIIFVLFLLAILIFAPLFIVSLWDCQPLPEGDLKSAILSFCRSQGITFRKIMSWNAMNKGLVTAGVIGLFPPFRFLLLTPQLVGMLNRDEILGVVSHEVGHVKRRHLFFYLLFFIGFIIFIIGTVDRLLMLFFNTSFGFSLVLSADGTINDAAVNFFRVLILVVLLVVYFRFIFGYFMRSFERQADAYCFKAGVDAGHLVSSFQKLAAAVGDEGKRRNWHHYNISQRIDFLKRCQADPAVRRKHDRRVKLSLAAFALGLAIFIGVSFNPYTTQLDKTLGYGLWTNFLEEKLEKDPANPQLYSLIGAIYYEMEKWGPAKRAYELSLELNYDQAEVLNNLAWLLLTCPDKKFHDPRRALDLAEDAVRLQQAAHTFDTLAEAYLQNGKYKEALAASYKALQMAEGDRKYYRDQFNKMKKLYSQNRSLTRI